MLATDKQINYLTALADKVEGIQKRFPFLDIQAIYIDWNRERRYGVTTTDASARIKAYKQIIAGANLKLKLLGFKQV